MLRAEPIYINGALLRKDTKTTMDLADEEESSKTVIESYLQGATVTISDNGISIALRRVSVLPGQWIAKALETGACLSVCDLGSSLKDCLQYKGSHRQQASRPSVGWSYLWVKCYEFSGKDVREIIPVFRGNIMVLFMVLILCNFIQIHLGSSRKQLRLSLAVYKNWKQIHICWEEGKTFNMAHSVVNYMIPRNS